MALMETKTGTLAEFLLARIAEDEARLPEAHEHRPWYGSEPKPSRVTDPCGACGQERSVPLPLGRPRLEVEAKRRIVALHQTGPVLDHWEFGCTCGFGDHRRSECACGKTTYDEGEYQRPYGPCPTLCALAQPYADHPDFREEWRG
jgi:hypothetical protein